MFTNTNANKRMIRHVYSISDHLECYIGSTNDVDRRVKGHRSKSNVCSSKPIIDRNNYTVKILMTLENVTDEDIRKQENFFFMTTNCVNKNRPYIYSYEVKQLKSESNSRFYKKNKHVHWNKKITCNVCDVEIRKDSLSKHKKSIKHLNCVQNNKE